MLGIEADSCTVDSASEVTAVFNLGYPLTDNAEIPILRLTEDCESDMQALCLLAGVKNKYTVLTGTEVAGIANPFNPTEDASLALTCSFAGGCHRTVKAMGLTNSVKHGQAEIKVCGRPCLIYEPESTDEETVF